MEPGTHTFFAKYWDYKIHQKNINDIYDYNDLALKGQIVPSSQIQGGQQSEEEGKIWLKRFP